MFDALKCYTNPNRHVCFLWHGALSGTARDTEHSEVAVKTAKVEKAMQMKSDLEAKTTGEGVAVGSANEVDPVEKVIRMKSDLKAETTGEGVAVGSAHEVSPVEKIIQMKPDLKAKTIGEGVAIGSANVGDPVEKLIQNKEGSNECPK